MPDTTAYAPAPAPPKRRSFAGAVVLIAIGVVLLLANAHVITWAALWRWFAHYWPVFLILYGAVKLIEYYQAQRQNRPFSGIGAGGVVMVVFLIVLGLTASGIERVRGQINWNEINGDIDFDESGFGAFLGNTYTFSQELTQGFPAGSTLKVVSDRGAVDVVPWDQNTIKVVVSKKIRADNQEEANKTDQATQATITPSGTEITVNANISAASRPVESDLQIFVPSKAAVNVSTRRGDVSVRDRVGNVKVNNSGGDVSLENITGNADVSLRPAKGSVRALKVNGNVAVDGRVEDTTITEVSGTITMTGDYFGDMNVSKVAKGVIFKSPRTDLQFAKLDGDMTLQSGDLRATQLTGPVRVITRSKNIDLEDVTGDVRLQNSNGSIDVRSSKLPLGQISIDNSRGEVNVVLPSNANFQLDAKARKGEINSEFANVNVNNERGNSAATGTVGAGGSRVQINAEYGNVSIRKAG
ncbi:MAG TPA: DUF4097 family beta strand repeat-containing protein [Terriglobales bacterium]|nr:DUF4097 family beta strand repeat-containing protein [Terriglobales bacterium]